MSISAVLLLGGFVVFALLMIVRLLPTLLALPIMAGWIALVTGVTFFDWLGNIVLQGALRLGAPIILVIFGSMFAKAIQKTGISEAIIKKAAEFAGDKPLVIAVLMTGATAFVFLGMSGLGAVIMIGSIAIPIMTSAGIEPIDAAILILWGIGLGSAFNFAGAATGIGIFGSEAVLKYYFPAAIIALIITTSYIAINIPRGRSANSSTLDMLKAFIMGLLTVPASIVKTLIKNFSKKSSSLVKKKEGLPSAALITPVIPLMVVGAAAISVGLGSPKDGLIDPVAVAVLGFIVATFYAALMVRPSQAVQLFTGSLVEGIQDVAGVLFLFMGIGMLVTAATQPAAVEVLDPMMRAVFPSSFYGMLIFFAIFAPAALYRGPFNMYGMGSGIATILTSLNFLPASALYGMFNAVGNLQGIDPTNSQNTWLGGFAGVDVNAIMKKMLPYAWAACIMMLICVAVLQ